MTVVALCTLSALALVAAFAATPASAAIDDPDASPTQLWVFDNADGDDAAIDVAVNSGGSAYVCGRVTSAAGDLDGSLYKFPPSGAGWQRTWDGPAHGNDAFYAVAVGPDGSVYTVGGSRTSAGRLEMRLVKWSKAGVKLWTRSYNGPRTGEDLATDVVVDKNGNVTVCGESAGAEGQAFTVVSWTATGTRRWVRRIEGDVTSSDRAQAMVVDGSGNLYVTGYRGATIGTAGYTVKLSPSGATKWSDTYTGADTILLRAMAKRRAGGVYVCGSFLGSDTGWDGLLLKYTAAGARTVVAIDTGDGADGTDTSYAAVAVTPTGKIAVAGSVGYDYGDRHSRYFRIYDAATGLPGYGAAYATTLHDAFAAVAADAYGGVYFTGIRALTGAHTVFWTHRYSTIPDGGTWTGQFGAGWVGANAPAAIATWRTTVWVVGEAYPSGTDSDQLILKYVY